MTLIECSRQALDVMEIKSLFDLSGKVAVVTGGADGIGKGCCEILASAGASVVVSDLNADKAKVVTDGIVAAGGKAIPVTCNVLQDADLVNLIDTTVKTFGTVNILVNNAGLGGGGRENPFKIDVGYVERIYRINVFAPLRLCQLAVPEMSKSGYGSIINITSMSSIDKGANMCVYSSSKAALASILTPEIQEKMLRHTPIHRLGEVSDIAQAVLFFASPASAWISGQVLFVNGGGDQTLD